MNRKTCCIYINWSKRQAAFEEIDEAGGLLTFEEVDEAGFIGF